MKISLKSREPHAMAAARLAIILVLALALIPAKVVECTEEYQAVNCRAHSAKLTQFGGVGDGKTSNTDSFQIAINYLSRFASQGGSVLIVPAGKWLTGSFNLTSNFTLYLEKGATILASQDESEYPLLPALPSYGRGRDATAGRYSSLIFGRNLSDVVITGNNGTIDGQGAYWWGKFKRGQLNETRPYLIEIMWADQVQISNITLMNSPSWNVHPIYSTNVFLSGLTILAPVDSPNTDGIDPDSCARTWIQDSYIVSGDDCIAVKSGWDEYGIKYGMPTEDLLIKRVTCISPYSAAIAFGSEMSGGIQRVWAEDVTAINTESGIRIKTAVGRGGYVKDIYARRFNMKTMKYAFWMSGNYGQHPDPNYDPKALPEVKDINFRDMTAENVTYAGSLEGIKGSDFTGICISNVTIGLAHNIMRLPWNCTDVAGTTNRVTPKACDQLPEKGTADCDFPEYIGPPFPSLKTCSVVSKA